MRNGHCTPLAALAFILAAGAVLTTAPAALCSERGTAQGDTLTARKVFADLPGTELELLSRSTRLDMLDYYDADSIYRAPNLMEGRSWLDTVTPGYLKVTVTPVSTLEIRILPLRKGGQAVVTVYTVGDEGQAHDSEVQFYDAWLNPLDASKMLKLPVTADFLDPAVKKGPSARELAADVPFPTVEWSASADGTELTARLTAAGYLDAEACRRLEPVLVPSLTYTWDGSRYRLAGKKAR